MLLNEFRPCGQVATATRTWWLWCNYSVGHVCFVWEYSIRSFHVYKNWYIANSHVDTCAYAIIKVGKVKSSAKIAHPRLLGRQVLARYASFVAARWLHQMEG